MEISVFNHVGDDKNNYEPIFFRTCYSDDLFLVSSKPISAPQKVILYSTELDLAKNIYIEFLNADSLEEACKFCAAYGALLNPLTFSSHFSDIHNLDFLKEIFLEAEKALLQDDNVTHLTHDFILYRQFKYYRTTLMHISKLQTYLHKNTRSYEVLRNILHECLDFITDPLFHDIYPLEYRPDTTPYSNFEIYQYMFQLNTFCQPKMPSDNRNLSKIRNLLLNSILSFYYLLDSTCKGCKNHCRKSDKLCQKSNSPCSSSDKLCKRSEFSHENFLVTCLVYCQKSQNNVLQFADDYLINHRRDILNLATSIVDNALSFHLQEVYPIVSCKQQNGLNFHFPSLISAIFFYYSYEINGAFEIKRCANENCQKLFSCSANNKRRIYCCFNCAHSTANRNSRKRIKNQKKQSQSNNSEEAPNTEQV